MGQATRSRHHGRFACLDDCRVRPRRDTMTTVALLRDCLETPNTVMPLYRARIFELDPVEGPPPPYRGRGWEATLRVLDVTRTAARPAWEEPSRLHHTTPVIRTERLTTGAIKHTFAPEVVIKAQSRQNAQRALNMITAAKTLLDGDFILGNTSVAIPDDPTDYEDLSSREYGAALSDTRAAQGYGRATAIAAKATQKKQWMAALARYWLSLRDCSIPVIETDPSHGQNFTVETDPFNHAIMAQAIVTAFSAIEDLGLKIVSSGPPKPDGKRNPATLDRLNRALVKANIDPSDPIVWMVRNSPRRMERKHGARAGSRPSWARGSTRDRNVPIVDAIYEATALRNQAGAHKLSDLTRSLTAHDVINVQHLVRRLLLETFGFWARL
jgi:hypothetical protein